MKIFYIFILLTLLITNDLAAKDDKNLVCGSVTNIFAYVYPTETNATISWSFAGTPLGYEVEVTQNPIPSNSPTLTSTLLKDFNGLSPNQLYYFHIRTKCGVGDYSPWISTPFFTQSNDLLCDAKVLTLDGPSHCANSFYATTSTEPAFTCSVPNNTLWYKYTPATSGYVDVNISRNGAVENLFTWVQFYTLNGSCNVNNLTQLGTSCSNNVDLNEVSSAKILSPFLTAGITYYIMIDGFEGDTGGFCIEIDNLPPAPPCVTNISPPNLSVGNYAPFTTLQWNSTPTATSYDIIFGTTNPPTTNIGNIVTTSTPIGTLNYNTTYYWYVNPKNGNASAACASNTTSFTPQTQTNCVPIYGVGCTDEDVIKLFRLKGETTVLNKNTGLTCTSSYSDFTTGTTIIDLAKGKSYWGKMSVGYDGDYVSIWIDKDDDGFFENDERLLNNLLVSTTETYFSIFIPLTFTTGNHRMRVRNVYYFNQPDLPTDPCNTYSWGETEDYTVNIANGGSSYTVSTYTPNGNCHYSTETTVDGFSNNNSNYLPLVDSLNSLVAQIYPQGNNLSLVSYSYYKHNGATRQDQFGRYYLNRNITIKSSYNPSTPINVRLPYLTSELNALIAQPGSGVTSQFDLVLTENSGICSNMYQNNTCQAIIFPTGYGSLSGDRFLDITNLSYLGSFYIHGGSTPIGSAVALTSISSVKSGNWNDKSTWSGCGNLPTETIDVIINAGHKIILNNTMGIQKCRKLNVMSGAVFDNTGSFFLAKP